MTSLDRLASMPTWLLSRANLRAHSLLNEQFEAHGFRGYHFRLLAALEQIGPASQAELGRMTSIDRSDVVAALNDLALWGCATRDPDPDDRRRNLVSVTETGLERLDQLNAVLTDVQNRVLLALSPPEREELVRLLTKLDAHSAGAS